MSLIDDAVECGGWGRIGATSCCVMSEADLRRLREKWLAEDTQRRVLQLELERVLMMNEHLGKVLLGIRSLLYPPMVKLPDGRTFAFKPKDLDPHACMQELSDRIRAIPDEIAALPLDKEAT